MLDSRTIHTSMEDEIDAHKLYHVCKRYTDIIGSVIALVILSPVILVLALLIFMQDKHNPFYMQVRVGKNGRIFKMIKFRSMIYNADKILMDNQELYQQYVKNGFKLPEGQDPRITKIGDFIRRTSLDEIPQFINILKGDMSLVGPRPIVPKEQVEYGDRLDEFLSVKPGALGLWQASGRSNIGYPERCDIELSYVENASYLYDIVIFFKCCISILKKDGAF